MPSFLTSHSLRLVLFGGKGGVGKTTCAAATALRLAEGRPGSSYLLVSTDPAHSIADSVGHSGLPANLTVVEIDSEERLAAFKSAHASKLREIANRGTFLDDADIHQLLDLSLPGLDEVIAFLELGRWIEEDRYASIVVDTAPWGHTLRLLEMPDLIGRWIRALDTLLAKHRYMRKLYRGAYRPDELDTFLLDLNASLERAGTVLRDPIHCRFVPVTLAERLSVGETLGLVDDLTRLKIPVTDVVVNRLHPDLACPACQARRTRQLHEIARLSTALPGFPLWGVPLFAKEVRGGERLRALWTEAVAIGRSPLVSGERGSPPPARVDGAPPLPPSGTELVIFAGKGGVGKTTLACATAVRLASERPEKPVLLLSTDPAHSLSACLDHTVGSGPTPIVPGLVAMEIDAGAELDALRRRYGTEIERTLATLLPDLDLTFDREVMERILDLSPPGLDEVMALSRAGELLATGEFGILVLDAAPTGHLIRLLEMPALIERWLRAIFGLFLKYRRVLRLPGVATRLVKLSRDLKRVQGLLADRTRSALYAVTIPTEMAWEETRDLLAACVRMKVNAPVLFVNLATPASDCRLCSALRERESRVERRFRQSVSGLHQALVHVSDEPVGVERLRELGRSLYQPA